MIKKWDLYTPATESLRAQSRRSHCSTTFYCIASVFTLLYPLPHQAHAALQPILFPIRNRRSNDRPPDTRETTTTCHITLELRTHLLYNLLNRVHLSLCSFFTGKAVGFGSKNMMITQSGAALAKTLRDNALLKSSDVPGSFSYDTFYSNSQVDSSCMLSPCSGMARYLLSRVFCFLADMSTTSGKFRERLNHRSVLMFDAISPLR